MFLPINPQHYIAVFCHTWQYLAKNWQYLAKIIGSLGSLHTTGYRIKLCSSSIYVEIGKKGGSRGNWFYEIIKNIKNKHKVGGLLKAQ